MSRLASFWMTCLLLNLGNWSACSTEVDLYAPAEAMYAVYGVLDPGADSQVVRIGRVFQPRGQDAFAFAEDYDPSLAGLQVRLHGPDRSYLATWRDSVLRDTGYGAFGPTLGYYHLATPDSLRLQAGTTYRLEITSADTLRIFGETLIPPRPEITLPRTSRRGGQECLPRLAIEDSLRIFFLRNASGHAHQAYGHQLRLLFDYYHDGAAQRYVFGPTRLFTRNVGCSGLTGEVMCYEFGQGALLDAFRAGLAPYAEGEIGYIREPRCVPQFTGFLPQSLRVEVISVDQALGEYITVYRGSFTSLNPLPPIYTNLEGTHRSIGVFGSITRHSSAALLTPCAEYQLGLIDLPNNPCR
jgi:hypothetical protein